MPVADRGRGGFDSHTFPPVLSARARRALVSGLAGLAALAAVAACVLFAARPAGAQSSDPSDVPPFARPDSAGVTPPPGDTLRPPSPERTARGELARPWHRQPWAVMTRSALVPGWGQLVNGREIKAVLVAGAEVGAGIQLLDAYHETQDALDREREAVAAGDEEAADRARAEYDRAYDRRSTWAWITATVIALSMLDAYVDAHLLQFDADFGPDPQLFDDDDGDASSGRVPGAAPEVRAGLRFHFQGPGAR